MSDNPQFKRTDKAIIHALVTLLKRKPFEKITVQDILDETPVTRATFYAHYRDKYEIAEKMLEHCISIRDDVRKNLTAPSRISQDPLSQSHQIDREYALALLKIHTEDIDLRKALADELEKEYLAHNFSSTREIEARIYAQAYVELYLSLINTERTDYTPELTNQIFISVALNMLHLTDDHEVRRILEDRLARKFGNLS